MRKHSMARVGAGGGAAAGLAVLAITAAACSGGTPSTSAAPPTRTSAIASHSMSPGEAATVVPVSETEFKIRLPRTTFPAGNYTFLAKNDGRAPHALRITGPGVWSLTGTLEPGQSVNLTVTLRPGRYDLDCPVDNHAALGMKQTITVT
jgi:hypothetical protein